MALYVAASLPEAAHGLGHADDQSLGNQGMADRNLKNIRQGGNEGRQVLAGEIMAGIEPHAGGGGCLAGGDDPRQFALARLRFERSAIGAGIYLDPIGADLLGEIGISGSGSTNRETRMPPCFSLPITSTRKPRWAAMSQPWSEVIWRISSGTSVT